MLLHRQLQLSVVEDLVLMLKSSPSACVLSRIILALTVSMRTPCADGGVRKLSQLCRLCLAPVGRAPPEIPHLHPKEAVHDHDLELAPGRIAHDLVAVLPISVEHVSDGLHERRRLVHELEHVDHAADVVRDVPDDVERERHGVGVAAPRWVPRALPRVVIAVLGTRRAVQIEDDVYAVLLRPVQALEEVGPCAVDIGRHRRIELCVCGCKRD